MKNFDGKACRSGLGLLVMACMLVCGLPSCGHYEGDQLVNLMLSLETREIPGNTKEIRYYILPNIVYDEDGEELSLDCHTFMGAEPVSVFEYSEFFVDTGTYEPKDILSRIDISITELPVGRHIFYLEALGDASDPLACGCGMGQIEAGEKTQIRIRLITECL